MSGPTYTPTVPSTGDALIGRTLDGRYRVLRRIADGGMATVYLAVDERLDREVALKVMRAHLVHDESFVTRFRREARSSASLSHPNVVAVFDQGEDDGNVFLAMEYVPGADAAGGVAGRRAAQPARGPRRPGAGAPRSRRGALQGAHPPRRQAGERHPQHERHGEGGRLRAGPRGVEPHDDELVGAAPRDGRLSLPRAGRARYRGPPLGRLRGRARALRDAHRHEGVHR